MSSKSAIELFLTNSSLTTTILIAIVVIALSLLFLSYVFNPYFYTPGPWGIPILGFFPFLRKEDYYIHLTELSKKHGDVYLLSLLGKRFLHVGSHKSIREVLVTKSDCFSGRPQGFSLFQYVFQDGLFYINGEKWKILRKHFVQAMREIGIGPKEQMKNPLSNSLQCTLDYLTKHQKQPVNITLFLFDQCTEVIRRLILGNNITSETAQKLQNAYLACSPMPTVANLFVGSIAKYFVLKWIPGYDLMISSRNELINILKSIVDEHKASFDPENPRDLIDIYLRDRKLKEEKGDPQAKYFTDISLISTLIQVYGDGGSSIGALVAFYLKILAEYPKVQNELYEEINSEIGINRLPTYEDRKYLPLMNSVIKEMERKFASVVAISSVESNYDTTISGIFVPKGTIVIENFNSAHNDPTVYKDPESFNPRRFLAKENSKEPKEELPILFSVGKRACAGEPLVAAEIFVYLTSIMQHFTIQLASKEQIKDAGNDVEELLSCIILATPR